MKKVLTMTLNPCIDRTIYFRNFKQGATNYVDNLTEEAAGKGINVAVALSNIGVPVEALGFSYAEDTRLLYGKLEQHSISHRFVELPGRMRVNQKLFDLSNKEMTECNERGHEVDKEATEQLLSVLEEKLPDAELLVLSGSVPPGMEKNIYARMIGMAKKKGVKTVLDASGEAMVLGCGAQPYIIKPNREEFLDCFLGGKEEKDAFCRTAMNLVDGGIAYVCVSLGNEGMLLADRNGVEKYPAKAVEIKSLQGAGDAMVAGLCKAIYEKEEKNMAEYAIAMAASTISLPGTQMGSAFFCNKGNTKGE